MVHSLFANTEPQVAGGITLLFAILLAALILCLALEEKLHAKKSVIAGIFAIICLLLGAVCGVLPFDDVVIGSHAMTKVEQLEGDYVLDIDSEHKPHHVNEDEAETVHVDGHRLEMPVYIPGINWAVIAIILGSSTGLTATV